MIKIVKDFLPRPLFDYMKKVVENENGDQFVCASFGWKEVA